jgi:hypothetical protein
LLDFDDSTLFLSQVLNDAFPVSVAEPEAEQLWRGYQSRRSAQLCSEAADNLTLNPERAGDIRAHVVSELQRLDDEHDSLSERLAKRLYRAGDPLPQPVTVFFIGNTQVSTADNITTISAQVKAGKSAAIGAMIASTFAIVNSDCLGFRSRNPDGLAVIHIDTEQSPYDHHQLVERAVFRAGREAAPEWLLSYCLTGFSAPDIRKAIYPLVKDAAKRFKGVLAVLLDGVADAANDVNDPAESNAFVAELHALAIEFHCTVVTVIHLNPGSDFKTRGHLGSQLERKAETNLRLEKDDETITLWADKNRRAPIPKNTAPRFAWNEVAGMHVSVESQQVSKESREQEELENLFVKVFTNKSAMSFTDLRSAVKRAVTVGDRTAERKIARAVTLGILRKTFAGLYESRT